MKVGFVTDLHVREQEAQLHGALLQQAVDLIREEDPDLILVGGDLAGREVPHRASIIERNLLVGFLTQLAEVAPVLVCRGNHDAPGDYEFLNAIHGIQYFDRPSFWNGWVGPDSPFETMDVFILPWLDQTSVSGEWTEGVLAAYRERLHPIQNPVPVTNKYQFFLGHCAIQNAVIRLGQPQVPTADPVLSLENLFSGRRFTAAFFGHYHQPQILDSKAVLHRAAYGGSLFVNEYGEDPDRGVCFWAPERGYYWRWLKQPVRWLVEIGRGYAVTQVQPGALKLHPSVHTVNGVDGLADALLPKGDRVKLRMQVKQENLPEARVRLAKVADQLRKKGATEVKTVFDVDAAQRTRISPAKLKGAITFKDKFGVWAGNQSHHPGPEVMALAEQYLGDIQNELAKQEAEE